MIFAGSVDGCDFFYAVKVESDALERCKFVFVDFVVVALFEKGYASIKKQVFFFFAFFVFRSVIETEFYALIISADNNVLTCLMRALLVVRDKVVSVNLILLVGRIGFVRTDLEVRLCRITVNELIQAVCVNIELNDSFFVDILREFRADVFFFRKVVRATLELAVYVFFVSRRAGG